MEPKTTEDLVELLHAKHAEVNRLLHRSWVHRNLHVIAAVWFGVSAAGLGMAAMGWLGALAAAAAGSAAGYLGATEHRADMEARRSGLVSIRCREIWIIERELQTRGYYAIRADGDAQ